MTDTIHEWYCHVPWEDADQKHLLMKQKHKGCLLTSVTFHLELIFHEEDLAPSISSLHRYPIYSLLGGESKLGCKNCRIIRVKL